MPADIALLYELSAKISRLTIHRNAQWRSRLSHAKANTHIESQLSSCMAGAICTTLIVPLEVKEKPATHHGHQVVYVISYYTLLGDNSTKR